MNGIYVDWSEDSDFFDLGCPNTIHHTKYGYGWATLPGNITDLAGKKCAPYTGCDICEADSGQVNPIYNNAHPTLYSGYTEETRCEIARKTDCVLVRKISGPNDEWYITLTDCGFDVLPDIAAAFLIADNDIPSYILLHLNYDYCKKQLSPELFRKTEDAIKATMRSHQTLTQSWIDARKLEAAT